MASEASTAICPRCMQQNYMPACKYCLVGIHYVGPRADDLKCQHCSMPFTQTPCVQCGAIISASAFARRRGLLETAAGGGGCFVATELYGPESVEVSLLRRFRDQNLLTNRWSAKCVTAYYRVSPVIVSLIRRSKLVRVIFRGLVEFSIRVVRRKTEHSP
jgi:hypothetical protein